MIPAVSTFSGCLKIEKERVHSERYLRRTSCPTASIAIARQDVGAKQSIKYRRSLFAYCGTLAWSSWPGFLRFVEGHVCDGNATSVVFRITGGD